MKVLVTGGAGFQGSNLSRALLDRGEDVTILSTLSDRSRDNIKRFGLQDAQIVWGSITDSDCVEKTVRDHDLVFHLAANIHVGESINEPGKYYSTNIMGTYNVVEQCRRERIPLIHVSTCEVYGGCNLCPDVDAGICNHLIRESCPLKPQSPYAASKAGAELLAFAASVTYNQRMLILRPGNAYGPGQRFGTRGAVIPIFVRQALRGDVLHIIGDGTQTRDFVFIGDLIRAYIFLMEKFMAEENLPRIVNIGTGQDISIRELASLVVKLTGDESCIVHNNDRPGQVRTFRLDNTLLTQLGFSFEYSFKQGLAKYVEWFQQHEDVA